MNALENLRIELKAPSWKWLKSVYGNYERLDLLYFWVTRKIVG